MVTTRNFRRREQPKIVLTDVHYLNVGTLKNFINERGKLSSAVKSSNSNKLQRHLRQAVLRARFLALLPYAPSHRRATATLARGETNRPQA